MKRDLKIYLQGAAAGAVFGVIAGVLLTLAFPETVFYTPRGFLVMIGGCALAGAVGGMILAHRWRKDIY